MADEPLTFADGAQWESWLDAHHADSDGVWLKVGKKGTAGAIKIGEALEGALCYGWIDSHRKGLDGEYFLQRYSPRRPKGYWSQRNVDSVNALIEAGRMRPAGLAEVAAAKADGRWQAAYAAQADATEPDDLAAALNENEFARAAFDRLSKTERYRAILELEKARRPETRAKRLSTLIRELVLE